MHNTNFKHNTEMLSNVNSVSKNIRDINQFLEISAISLNSEFSSLNMDIICSIFPPLLDS